MKFTLILGFIFAVIALAFAVPAQKPILGADKCTYGPAHWCESRENAEKCGPGAVQHCTSKVWGKQ